MATTDQRNAAFDAAKAKLTEIIDNEGGMFASTIEGDITSKDILAVVDAVLAAAEGVKT
jgi:hypothetical protein